MKRREFLSASAGAAAGMMLLNSKAAFGYEANSAVRLGLLGCGNRGTEVADSFSRNTSAQVVAIGDLFPDNLARGRACFDELNRKLGRAPIDPKLLFHGSHAYQQLAESKEIDAIQISTPPFFHVQHLGAAVAAGKHIYVEKPVGIDVRQTKQALEIAKKVGSKQSVDVGFQCRNASPLAEAARRIRAGALGRLVTLAGMYNAPASTEKKREGEGPDEYRLRNWLWDRALSGDILVEQNIHIIDLANWIIGAHPLKATATGGRNVLTHFGDCWDHYEVIYTYPNDVRFSFSSTQFGGSGLFEAGLRLFGTEGMATYPYSGPCEIKGAQKWSWAESLKTETGAGKFAANGAFSDNLADADSQKEKSFIASIISGPVHNEIADGVQTALSCMLGRMAGLEKREVAWEELEAKGESYELGINMEQFA